MEPLLFGLIVFGSILLAVHRLTRTPKLRASSSETAEASAGALSHEDRRAGGAAVAPRALLDRHLRSTWIPITEPGERDDAPNKFGGSPWFLPRTRLPTCHRCKEKMRLAIQVQMSMLPPGFLEALRDPPNSRAFVAQVNAWKKREKIKYDYRRLRMNPKGEGLFQAFVCAGDDCLCETDRGAWTFRFLPYADCRPRKNVDGCLPARTIVGWREAKELPHPDDWDRLGVRIGGLARVLLEEEVDLPFEGDKLGGWPHWEQASRVPPGCGPCDAPLDFFFQIASDDNLPIELGDEGKAYLFLCPVCPEHVTPEVQYG